MAGIISTVQLCHHHIIFSIEADSALYSAPRPPITKLPFLLKHCLLFHKSLKSLHTFLSLYGLYHPFLL
jgi:hypothetical protein